MSKKGLQRYFARCMNTTFANVRQKQGLAQKKKKNYDAGRTKPYCWGKAVLKRKFSRGGHTVAGWCGMARVRMLEWGERKRKWIGEVGGKKYRGYEPLCTRGNFERGWKVKRVKR